MAIWPLQATNIETLLLLIQAVRQNRRSRSYVYSRWTSYSEIILNKWIVWVALDLFSHLHWIYVICCCTFPSFISRLHVHVRGRRTILILVILSFLWILYANRANNNLFEYCMVACVHRSLVVCTCADEASGHSMKQKQHNIHWITTRKFMVHYCSFNEILIWIFRL